MLPSMQLNCHEETTDEELKTKRKLLRSGLPCELYVKFLHTGQQDCVCVSASLSFLQEAQISKHHITGNITRPCWFTPEGQT